MGGENIYCGCTPYSSPPSLDDMCTGTAVIIFMALVESAIRRTCKKSDFCDRIISTPEDEYDFIVIGGGSAGAAVAGRLSEESKWKVLLVEAGLDEPPVTQVPMFDNIFSKSNVYDWQYRTEPEPAACMGYPERRCPWPRAKMLGGSSSINGMMYSRGTPADFEGWVADGNKGWGYREVLPWFKYSENNPHVGCLVDDDYHGEDGPITVRRFKDRPKLALDMLTAASEMGFPVTNDINEKYVGFTIAQATNSDSSCTANYFGPSILEVCPGSTFLVFMTLMDNLIRNTDGISEACERITPTLIPDDEYDFVVIGGGSGGATVAGRLSEVSDWKVLLIEAGVDEPVVSQLPPYMAAFTTNNLTDWLYKTEPEPQACLGKPEQRCTWPRAKMLGGCSSINGMMHTRGTPADFKGWADAGNDGWSYEDVLPWYKHSENNTQVGTLVDETYHGTEGPVTVSRFNDQPELAWDILTAAEEIGFSAVNDIDADPFSGFAIAQADNKGGVRLSSSRAFLRPARERSNLNIMLNSTVTKITVSIQDDIKRATGVELVYNGEIYNVKAKKEVILSAGAINSPQVLLLSGIGPKDVLGNVGIDQIHELPGVGKNLTNHVSFSIGFTLTNVTNTNILNEDTLNQYIENRDGPLSSTGMSQVTARLNSKYADAGGNNPDVQLFFGGYTQRCTRSFGANDPQDPSDPDAKRTLSISPVNLHPKSRGYVALQSSDPFVAPIMAANYLTAPGDIEVLVDAIRIIQNLTSSETLVSKYGIKMQDTVYGTCGDEYEYDSDDYWKCALRYATGPENHQGSSCRMGPSSDKFAVVDNELRVYGIDDLRIADASIMPKLVSGNMHATVVMIAERTVDFIKKKWLD